MIRDIVKIDEEKCNGCGLCVPACAEGAIKIIDGKAKLIADNLCDGLGACLGDCPEGAIQIVQRDADEFDEEAVEEHLKQSSEQKAPHGHGGGCPSARVVTFDQAPPAGGCPSARVMSAEKAPEKQADETGTRQSQLRQWPVQMTLVPPTAPFLKEADLLLAADCAPFAYADFHKDFLQGKALLIGCPKLDDGQAYQQKLTAMLQSNDIKSLTVVHMEVPCCTGLVAIVKQALVASGKDIPFETVNIGIRGERK